jgi:hypothetical protein
MCSPHYDEPQSGPRVRERVDADPLERILLVPKILEQPRPRSAMTS